MIGLKKEEDFQSTVVSLLINFLYTKNSLRFNIRYYNEEVLIILYENS